MFERENLHSFIYSHSNSGTLLVGAHDDETIQDEDPARTLLSLVIATIDDGHPRFVCAPRNKIIVRTKRSQDSNPKPGSNFSLAPRY